MLEVGFGSYFVRLQLVLQVVAVVAAVGWLRWLGQVALAGSARLWPALVGSGLLRLAGSAWPVGWLALTGWLAPAFCGVEVLAPLWNHFVAIYCYCAHRTEGKKVFRERIGWLVLACLALPGSDWLSLAGWLWLGVWLGHWVALSRFKCKSISNQLVSENIDLG